MGALFGGSGGQSQSTNSNTTSSTHYTPQYESYVSNVLDRGQKLADTPFKAYDIDKMFAGFSPDQQQAFDQVRAQQGQNQPYFGGANSALNRASSAYDPQVGMGYINRAGQGPTPYEAGSGYLRAGAQTWNPRTQAQYMNPYLGGALGYSSQLSRQNFLENTLPGITDQFVKSGGGLGRGRYQDFMNRALRDYNNAEIGQYNTAASNNYWQGANQFGQDQSRLQQAGMNMGNLSNSTMGALSNLGQAAQGVTTGAVNTGTGLAGAYTNTGGALANQNLTNTNALLQSGNLQQQQAQKPLTAGYQQFQQEQQWPFQMANFMSNLQRGLSIPTTQNSQSQSTTTTSGSSSPSILGGALGALSGIMGIPGVADWAGKQLGSLFGGTQTQVPGGGGAEWAQSLVQPATGGFITQEGALRKYAQGGPAFPVVTAPKGALAAKKPPLANKARAPLAARPDRPGGGPSRFDVGGVVPAIRGLQQQRAQLGPQMPGALSMMG